MTALNRTLLACADDERPSKTASACDNETGDCGGTTANQWVSKSTDGGKTWSNPVKIHDMHLSPDSCGAFYGCLPNTFERVSNIPVIAIDNAATSGNFGTLYVIDYDWTGTYMNWRLTWADPS